MAEEEAPKRAPEIRKDTVNNRWVVFSPARSSRPSDFKSKSSSDHDPAAHSQNCPFCIGNEHICAPELFRVPSDTHDWKVRVIQNLYPALSRDLVPSHQQNQGIDDADVSALVVSGFGFHDVVIESPVHSVHLWDLSPVQVGDVLQLQSIDCIQYIQHDSNEDAGLFAILAWIIWKYRCSKLYSNHMQDPTSLPFLAKFLLDESIATLESRRAEDVGCHFGAAFVLD